MRRGGSLAAVARVRPDVLRCPGSPGTTVANFLEEMSARTPLSARRGRSVPPPTRGGGGSEPEPAAVGAPSRSRVSHREQTATTTPC